MDQAITLFFNGSHSLYLDVFAWSATHIQVWIPFLLVIVYVLFKEHDFSHFCFILGAAIFCVVISDQIASSIFKPLIARWRPTHSPQIMHLTDVVAGYRGGYFGFFSSHAANTFSIATFLSLVFRNRNISLSLFAWAILNCWTRIYLGVHYFGDLLTGAVFGTLVAYLAFRVYCYYFKDATSFSYTRNQLKCIPLVFILTLCVLATPWRLIY